MAEKEMTAAELSTEFDRLSLHQTLIDFEIANARARDLTERLIHSTARCGACARSWPSYATSTS